jgi:dTDP-L-rhamnose 4-epimerase
MTIQSILITGGAGFIGSLLSKKLLAEGHKVTVIDPLTPQVHGNKPSDYAYFEHEKFSIIRDSILNLPHYVESLQDISVVYHLAAETGTNQSMYSSSLHVQTNCLGSAVLIDLITNNSFPNLSKIVLTSSRAVYGEGKGYCKNHNEVYLPPRKYLDLQAGDFSVKCPYCGAICTPTSSTESDHLQPVSIYGITKAFQEQQFNLTTKKHDLSLNILRLQNVYGEGQSLQNPYTGMLPIFLSQIYQSHPVNIFEDGLMVRDFIHIDDAISLLLKVIKSPISFTVNVGTGMQTKVFQLAALIKKKLQSDSLITISGDYRDGDIRANFADTKLLKYHFPDFSPISLEDGVNSYIDSLLSNPYLANQLIQLSKRFDKSILDARNSGAFHKLS